MLESEYYRLLKFILMRVDCIAWKEKDSNLPLLQFPDASQGGALYSLWQDFIIHTGELLMAEFTGQTVSPVDPVV